jgi:hypothetical protein
MSKRKVNKVPTTPPRAFGVLILFPERVWELASGGGWTSRPVTGADLERRRELAKTLGAAS